MTKAVELLQNALKHHQNGQLDVAASLYQKVLAANPANADALHLSGVIAHQQKEHTTAINFIAEAIKLTPNVASYHSNLGEAFRAIKKYSQAEEHYRQSLKLEPNQAAAHNNLGICLAKQCLFQAAIAEYQAALKLEPNHCNVLINLANVYHQTGKLIQAITLYRNVLQSLPNCDAAHHNLGNSLFELGEFEEAVEYHQRALQLQPRRADYLLDYGNVLLELGNSETAIQQYQSALQSDPNDSKAYHSLGRALQFQGNLPQAIECYQKAIQIEPEFEPDRFSAHSGLLLCMNYDLIATRDEIFEQHRRWGKAQAKQYLKKNSFQNDRNPNRRLKIGYVSPDFRQHAVSHFILPILQQHDRARFEITCYAYLANEDEVTQVAKKYADRWRNIYGLNDQQLMEIIQQDEIDILVDLAGHTDGNRLSVFSAKAAPIQVTYLGYPNTTGLEAIDYRLTDIMTDPVEHERWYCEKLVRLPDGFLCYQPSLSPAVEPLPALKTGRITFGSMNRLEKLNYEVIRLWSKVLQVVPNSRMILKTKALSELETKNRLLAEFRKCGVDESRIELLGQIPTQQGHLSVYHQIDLALDPFPYHGTTTTCEALWMGVASITLLGTSHAGRVGGSILKQVGLEQFIAETPEEYVEIARNSTTNLQQLSTIRTTLRQQMQESTLCNDKLLTTNIEKAFRQMWHEYCKTV